MWADAPHLYAKVNKAKTRVSDKKLRPPVTEPNTEDITTGHDTGKL